MDESRRWSLRAAFGFGLAAFGVAFAWVVLGSYTSSRETLRDGVTAADLAVLSSSQALAFVGAATVAGALVGGPAWALLVERWDRWSITRRGALAGAWTGCLAVPVSMGLLSVADATTAASALENVLVGLVLGLVGVVVVGWTTIPAGAATGYILALWRADDAKPVWGGLVERMG